MKKNLSVLLVVSMLLTTFLFAFNAFAVTSELRGDVTFDGKVSADDARLILRHSVHLEEFTDEQFAMADLNNDGRITAADARTALRISIGLEDDSDKPTTDPDEPPTEPEDPPTEPDEPTTEPDEPTTEPEDPPTQPDEPTTENLLNTIGGLVSPERAGLLYDKNGVLSTYDKINEGEIYYIYDENGIRDLLKKPYSPGNEPTTADFSVCKYCGKHTQPFDGEHSACYYGYCSRWLADVNCPECGVFVKAKTCHTCGQ